MLGVEVGDDTELAGEAARVPNSSRNAQAVSLLGRVVGGLVKIILFSIDNYITRKTHSGNKMFSSYRERYHKN